MKWLEAINQGTRCGLLIENTRKILVTKSFKAMYEALLSDD
jgi:hypothetical protein